MLRSMPLTVCFDCSWMRMHPWYDTSTTSCTTTRNTVLAPPFVRPVNAGPCLLLVTPSAAPLQPSSARLLGCRWSSVSCTTAQVAWCVCEPYRCGLIMIACGLLQSVSFSGPGIVFSKFQFTTQIGDKVLYPRLAKATNLATTFIPSHDLVPQVDGHLGNVQYTACSRMVPSSCHEISAMVCDLLLRCGDDQDQKRFHTCEAPFEILIDEADLENKLSA